MCVYCELGHADYEAAPFSLQSSKLCEVCISFISRLANIPAFRRGTSQIFLPVDRYLGHLRR